MKIIFCAYRDWGLKIASQASELFTDAEIKIVTEHISLEQVITDFRPNVVFFLGWSLMVPASITDNFLCICLHPSPLPKYRGGTPIQHQLIAGEKTSAVTLFRMTQILDAGEIYFQQMISLDGYLDDILKRIETVGFGGIVQLIKDIQAGMFSVTPQDETESTVFKRRKPSQSELLPQDLQSATDVYNLVRGLQPPYPRVYIVCQDGTKLYLDKVSLDEKS